MLDQNPHPSFHEGWAPGKDVMKIATGKSLSTNLRAMAHDVQRRLWISSPYVGGWKATKCLIDIVWQENPNVDVRLLTDIKNEGWLDPDTIKQFQACGTIKHLRGLHAKLFIVDDQVLLTSANLTRRAFTQRFEVGAFLSKAEATPVIAIFNNWWNNEAKLPPPSWIAKLRKAKPPKGKPEEPGGDPMKTKWSLPEVPDEDPHKNKNYRCEIKLKGQWKEIDVTEAIKLRMRGKKVKTRCIFPQCHGPVILKSAGGNQPARYEHWPKHDGCPHSHRHRYDSIVRPHPHPMN